MNTLHDHEPSLDPDPRDESPDITRRIITSLILIGLVLYAAFSVMTALAAKKSQTKKAEADLVPVLVRTMVAQRGDVKEEILGYGEVRVLHATSVAAEITGRCLTVDKRVEVGVPIKIGSSNGSNDALPILVTVDVEDYRIAKTRLLSEIDAQQAEIAKLGVQRKGITSRLKHATQERETAQREYDRIKKLVPRTASASELDRQRGVVQAREQQLIGLRAQLDDNEQAEVAANATLSVRQHDVKTADRNIARGNVRAPFEGVIVERTVQEGAWIRTGEPLFRVLDLSELEVAIALPASRYRAVRVGTDVSLFDPAEQSGAPKALYKGKVSRIDPSIQTGARSFRAYVTVKGSPTANPLAPGQPIRAIVQGETFRDVYQIPRQALLGRKVFLARPGAKHPDRKEDNEEKEPLPIDGEIKDDDDTKSATKNDTKNDKDLAHVHVVTTTIWRNLTGTVLLKEGLTDGDLVIMTNLESIDEGSTIRYINSDDDTDASASNEETPPTR